MVAPFPGLPDAPPLSCAKTNFFPKTWALLVLSLLNAAGCRPRDGRAEVMQRPLMHTGFETPASDSTRQASPARTSDKAHSGRVSVRVDAHQEYSASYRAALGTLCDHRPRRFTVGAWVWVPNWEADATLVLSITNPGDSIPLLSQRVYLSDAGPYKAWKYINRNVDLPASISSTSRVALTFSGASTGNDAVYADDLELSELW